MKTKILVLLLLSYCINSSAQKIVLIEQFTNSGCPPCAAAVPPITDYVRDNEHKVALIAYHTSFPYLDSMYHENKVESDAAVAYNGVQAVPQSIVDGNVYSGSSSDFVNKKESIVDARAAIAPKYSLTINPVELKNGILSGSITCTALDTSLKNTILKIAVVERVVAKSSYRKSPGKNAETEYWYVMRKMLPNFGGTMLQSAEQSVNFEWPLAHIKNNNQLRIIAFVQDATTKEVYQTEIGSPEGISSSISTASAKARFFSIYPNPATERLNIEHLASFSSLAIFSYDGRIVKTIEDINKSSIDIADLSTGLYFVRATLKDGSSQSNSFIKD